MGVQRAGQDARNVFEQPAAGDMRKRVNAAGLHQRQQALHIDAGRRHQRVDQQDILVEQGGAIELPALVGRESSHQRKAVGMNARRGEAKNHIARRDLVGGQHLLALDRADAKAGEVIIAIRIHAGHFGGFAADQRASGLFATLGDAGDDIGRDPIVELSGRIIIEEEQRLGPLNDQVVRAHGDQVDSDAVMSARIDRELQLGSDPVVCGDQQRIVEPCRLQVEKAAESAKVGIGARTSRRSGERGDGTDQRIAGLDRDAGPGISVGGGLVMLGIHGQRA